MPEKSGQRRGSGAAKAPSFVSLPGLLSFPFTEKDAFAQAACRPSIVGPERQVAGNPGIIPSHFPESAFHKFTSSMKTFFRFIGILLTIGAASMAIAGFAAGYIPPEEKEWISFPGLILLPVLAVNLLMFGIWWALKSGWLWVPLAALLLNAGFILSMFQIRIAPRPEVPLSEQIKIITYNVDNFYTAGHSTLAEIAGWLASEHPDIVCLQECPAAYHMPMDSVVARLRFLPYSCSTRFADAGSALAIFSRYPILGCEPVLYAGTTNKTLVATLLVGGDTIRVINNHLQTTSVNAVKPRLYQARAERDALEGTEAAFQMAFQMKRNFILRAEQADFVRQLIRSSSLPVIVCGDFNDTPASYAYHRVKGLLTDGFRQAGSGFGYTFRELRRLFRIDYIFYSSRFRGIRYDSPDLPYSDHNPVICTLFEKP